MAQSQVSLLFVSGLAYFKNKARRAEVEIIKLIFLHMFGVPNSVGDG